MVNAAKGDFGKRMESDYVIEGDLEELKPGLLHASYSSRSAVKNLGTSVWVFFILTKTFYVITSQMLFFATKKTRCG